MNEKDWLILKILSEELSITKASQKLFISQPALSYRIKQIEKSLNVKIIIRSKKGIQFTTEGEVVLDYALDMLLRLSRVKDEISNSLNGVQGKLRLGVTSNYALYKLPSILQEFLQKYPNVLVNVTTGRSSDIMQLLQKEEVHLGIVRGNHLWSEEKILLDREKLCIISKRKVNTENLPSIPRIDYKTDKTLSTTLESWWHHKFQQAPNITMIVDNMETCKEMVKHGLGYAIVPQLCIKSSDEFFIEIVSSTSIYNRDTWLVYRESLNKLSLIKAFIEFIKPFKEY